jgi:hypothetical protein
MALPFLVPMLIGAGVGAITNPDDRLRGALLGGTLGALTGGLGGAAAGAGSTAMGTGSAATSALGSAQAGLGGAASAEAAKQAAINAASGLSVAPQALGVSAPLATTTLGATEAAVVPSALSKLGNIAKEKPIKTAETISSLTGGNQQQQQAAPMQMAPIQQGSFGMPMSAEERLAMSGGDDPMFVQRGLFSEVKSDFQTEEEKELMMQQMRLAGLV